MTRHRLLTALTFTILLLSLAVIQVSATDPIETSVHVIGCNCDPTPPFADFIGSPTEGIAPLTVRFVDISTGYYRTRDWNFGDGSTASGFIVTHTYTNPGTYTVSLTIAEGCISDTMTKCDYITVSCTCPEPTAEPTEPEDSNEENNQQPGTPDGPTSTTLSASRGGGGAVFSFIENGTLFLSDEGKVLHTVTITSRDGTAKLTIPENTIALAQDGSPITRISLLPAGIDEEEESFESGTFTYAGYAYVLEPSGASFTPALTLTFTFTPDQWNALDGENLFVGCWDDEGAEWLEAETEIDSAYAKVIARCGHFSTFALLLRNVDTAEVFGEEDAIPEEQETVSAPSAIESVDQAPLTIQGPFTVVAFAIVLFVVVAILLLRRQ